MSILTFVCICIALLFAISFSVMIYSIKTAEDYPADKPFLRGDISKEDLNK